MRNNGKKCGSGQNLLVLCSFNGVRFQLSSLQGVGVAFQNLDGSDEDGAENIGHFEEERGLFIAGSSWMFIVHVP